MTNLPRLRKGAASTNTLAKTAAAEQRINLSQGGGFFGLLTLPPTFYQPSSKADSPYRELSSRSIANYHRDRKTKHHPPPTRAKIQHPTTMNKGEQPAADAQWGLGLSEERGAVRRDAGEKTYRIHRIREVVVWSSKGAMRHNGVEEDYWIFFCIMIGDQQFTGETEAGKQNWDWI